MFRCLFVPLTAPTHGTVDFDSDCYFGTEVLLRHEDNQNSKPACVSRSSSRYCYFTGVSHEIPCVQEAAEAVKEEMQAGPRPCRMS